MRFQALGRGIVACSLVLAGILVAQAQTKKIEVQREVPRRVEPAGRVSAEFPRASSIIGARVSIQDDVAIGKVEDLVLSRDGMVEYLVVLNEDKYVLVPWGAAKLDPGQRTV